ncbi:MAG: hypothetical protein E7639_06800 [Ruminococcaceae bacterium]|nr:hypothetical protein [Oscillospiraceae bacterium]
MPYLFFVGYTDIAVRAADAAAFFNICLALDCTPRRVQNDEEQGLIVCRFSTPCARQLKKKMAGGAITARVCGEGGLPFLCRLVRRAPALGAGLLLAVLLLIAGRLFLWDVEIKIEGEMPLGEAEVALAAAGLSRGAFLPYLDTDAIALSVRQSDGRFAFVSVNLTGTVAAVQVRVRDPEPPQKSNAPANIVAKCDAIITMPLVFEGECLVSEGEAVRAGQILVSGVMDTDNNGIRLSRAAGQILARTERQIEVFVPFSVEEKYKTGRVGHEIYINFFGTERKVFKNTGNISKSCDIIKSNRSFTVGERVLPFGFSLVRLEEVSSQRVRRTVPETLAEARAALAAELTAVTGNGALLSHTVTVAVEEDGVRLSALAVIECDIAEVVEFSVS